MYLSGVRIYNLGLKLCHENLTSIAFMIQIQQNNTTDFLEKFYLLTIILINLYCTEKTNNKKVHKNKQ